MEEGRNLNAGGKAQDHFEKRGLSILSGTKQDIGKKSPKVKWGGGWETVKKCSI